MIKHIIFDFGGVILDLDGVHTGYPDDLAVIFNLSIEECKQLWDRNKTAVITGKESPKEFLDRIKREKHLKCDTNRGIAYWEEKNTIIKDRIDWELIAIIAKLKHAYQIHMLTDQIQLANGASGWIEEINQHFHSIFRSYEQGLRKPFPEAYQNVLAKLNIQNDPRSVIFIDDNTQNVEAAQKQGIHGILYRFKDHKALREACQKLGVIFEK